MNKPTLPRLCAAALAGLLLTSAHAQNAAQNAAQSTAKNAPPAQAQAESAIRKNLAQTMKDLPAIDEVRPTPIGGLYEVRIGTDVLYADAEGRYLIQGQILDTRAQKNLTQERLDKLSAIDFKSLPTANAITYKRGNGKRQIAVFADPNCGYCKRYEADLNQIDNVTVHVYMIPILGPDSVNKTRNIWCAKDKAAAWQDWMLRNKTPANASCNTAAIDANLALARQYRITGTPAAVFESGRRAPGAIARAQIEQFLDER